MQELCFFIFISTEHNHFCDADVFPGLSKTGFNRIFTSEFVHLIYQITKEVNNSYIFKHVRSGSTSVSSLVDFPFDAALKLMSGKAAVSIFNVKKKYNFLMVSHVSVCASILVALDPPTANVITFIKCKLN